MSSPTVVKVADVAGFLRLVPRLVGMDPTRSLVLAAFTGNRSGGALRVDLPTSGADLAAFADTVVGLVCRLGTVDGIAAVVYTDTDLRSAVRGDAASLLGVVETCADRAGLAVKDLLLVASDGWCGVRSGIAHPAQPLSSIRDTDAEALLLDVDAAVRLPPRPAGVQNMHERAVAGRLRGGAGGLLRHDPSGSIEAALAGEPSGLGVPDEPTVLLGAALRVPALRDVVLLQIGWGREFGSHTWRRCREQPPIAPDEPITMAFMGGDMARPDRERVERGIERLIGVAALTSPPCRAPVLTALAWLHWALGRGSVAGRFLDLARAADPPYAFADLLTARLAAGVLPEWAFRDRPQSSAARRWRIRTGSQRTGLQRTSAGRGLAARRVDGPF